MVINGQYSSRGIINAGVPQGFVLGLLLFLIYINNITLLTESSRVRLVAIDTVLYLFFDNPLCNGELLDKDFENICNWAAEWLVKFSPSKTKTMVLTRKKKHEQLSPLNMNAASLIAQEVYSHTFGCYNSQNPQL